MHEIAILNIVNIKSVAVMIYCSTMPGQIVVIATSISVYLTFTNVLVPGVERSGTAGCADMMLTCTSCMPAAEPCGEADALSLKPLKGPLASCTLLHQMDKSRICKTTALDMYALHRNCSDAQMIDSAPGQACLAAESMERICTCLSLEQDRCLKVSPPQ